MSGSRDLSVYVDATLGWELNGYGALKEVWAQYMPTWGEGRSYPTRILGDLVLATQVLIHTKN